MKPLLPPSHKLFIPDRGLCSAAARRPPHVPTLQLWLRTAAPLVMISAALSAMFLQQPAKHPRGPALLYLAMQLTSKLKGLTEGQRCQLPNCSYEWRSKSLLTAEAACNPWWSLKSPTLRESVLNRSLWLLRPIKKLPSLCFFISRWETTEQTQKVKTKTEANIKSWLTLKCFTDASRCT